MKSLIKEPLIHFICLGALLFSGHNLWQNHIENTANSVVVKSEVLERKIQSQERRLERTFTAEEREDVRRSYIEDEILIQEARRLDLGQEDETVRRRLLQKMRFMMAEQNAPALPSTEELRNYYDANAADFMTAETRRYREIFLSKSTHGDALQGKAKQIEETLKSNPPKWYELGDPMMVPDAAPLTQDRLTRRYGRQFAQAIFALEPNKWSGVIPSEYGLHFIYVEDIFSPKPIPFKDAQQRAEEAWVEAKEQKAYRAKIDRLTQKYTVTTE